jgi:hypothetical protein
MLKGYTVTEDAESGCLLHQYTAVHVQSGCGVPGRNEYHKDTCITEGGIHFRGTLCVPWVMSEGLDGGSVGQGQYTSECEITVM